MQHAGHVCAVRVGQRLRVQAHGRRGVLVSQAWVLRVIKTTIPQRSHCFGLGQYEASGVSMPMFGLG